MESSSSLKLRFVTLRSEIDEVEAEGTQPTHGRNRVCAASKKDAFQAEQTAQAFSHTTRERRVGKKVSSIRTV